MHTTVCLAVLKMENMMAFSRNGWKIHSDEKSISFRSTVKSIVQGTEWWTNKDLPEFASIFGEHMLPHIGENRRTAIDVGASYGFVCDALCQLFQNVVAFEVDPSTRSFLKMNMQSYENLMVYAGAGRRNERVKVWRTNRFSGHTTTLPLIEIHNRKTYSYAARLTPIDSLNITDLDFLKIDVEGAEIDVLRGARETLIHNDPVLIVEFTPRCVRWDPARKLPCYYPGSEDDILNFLEPLGYRMVAMGEGLNAVFKKGVVNEL